MKSVDAKTIRLSDERTLGYAEYGKPDGVPVFYFHGTPGSRLLPDDEIAFAERIGIRLILPERPGFGFSDYQPNRTFLDWTSDVTQLADALHLSRVGIMGVSGGGPYVLACAYQIPERMTKAAVVSSVTPFDVFNDLGSYASLEQARASIQRFADEILETPNEWVNRALPDSPQEEKKFFVETFREAFRNGIEGHVQEEMMLTGQPWGFALDGIRADVQLWHGEDDEIRRAHYLSEHIPNSILHILPGIGHLIPSNYIEEIYRSFLE